MCEGGETVCLSNGRMDWTHWICVIQERKLEKVRKSYLMGLQLKHKESEKVRGLGKSGLLANL